ncbi:MAG: sulfatase-like hydrolase/transferase, partial [Kiritimatiellaeota bacterium]|nr:sulfatase-like hydrolase/transferase [Kiritimatiellota bacterium]
PEWRYEQTLPRTLAEAGYHTQCVGKMHVQPARNLIGFHNVVLHDGFLHDKRRSTPAFEEFDDYLPWLREHLGAEADIVDAALGCNGYAARVWPWDERLHPTSWTVTKSIEFLRRRDPTKPFFLNVSFHRPHCPLDPPRSFWDMHADTVFPPFLKGDWEDGFAAYYENAENPVPSDERSRNRARRAYHALVTQIDYELNRLFIALGDRQLWDDTLIIFCSDHGDNMFDHGMVRKCEPFETSAGIPLFIKFPRAMSEGRAGVTDERVCELRDIYPTICEICGIPAPQNIDGVSLLGGAVSPNAPESNHIHGEHPDVQNLNNHWIARGDYKYAWYSATGRELLFNLREDPNELHDLAPSAPPALAELRALLIRELTDRPEEYVRDGKLVAGRPARSAQEWAGNGRTGLPACRKK